MIRFWKSFLIAQAIAFLQLKLQGHDIEVHILAFCVVSSLSIPNLIISIFASNDATYNKWFWINYVIAVPAISCVGFMYWAAIAEWGEMVIQYPNMFGLWILITYIPVLWLKPKAI
ncbi:hypothetical protein [Aliiroseovarius crassostreae]|uniref:hypothetical protein n=1 Tax=Aliiroseovarius crassostreae TaxID=154981 RepID=UPI00220662A3|nr:hypothetical protein [Aliiroseovarius crassostreae]UWQ03717.1 hypothetical protein K3X22_08290 [Aliiroseovarius crassostreae]